MKDCHLSHETLQTWHPAKARQKRAYIGLAKKLIWVFPPDATENPLGLFGQPNMYDSIHVKYKNRQTS